MICDLYWTSHPPLGHSVSNGAQLHHLPSFPGQHQLQVPSICLTLDFIRVLDRLLPKHNPIIKPILTELTNIRGPTQDYIFRAFFLSLGLASEVPKLTHYWVV